MDRKRNSSKLKLLTILSQGWSYRGEGNANIVLSLPKLHQILRIKKTDKPTTILGWFFDWLIQIFQWDRKKDSEHEMENLQFYNNVMIPLLGKTYVHPATSIDTYRREIQKLDKELMPFRPAHRKHKRLQYGMATLFVDYAFLPEKWNSLDLTGATYAVEIKPKQGWIPLVDRNFDQCQFCMNQYLKLKNSQIKELSSYCPLDLFSGEKERMTKTLKSLILNPQNNLRIFKDGIYSYGDNTSVQTFHDLLRQCFEPTDSINNLMDDFSELMVQALLKDFYKNEGCVNCDDNSETLPHNNTYVNKQQNKCAFNETKLPLGCVLERILSLQKLNRLGLNKYYDTHEALIRNKIKFDDWSYVEKLLQEINCNGCPKCITFDRARHTEKQLQDGDGVLSDLDLAPYLIAAVVNDCSFMVTFRKIYNSGNNIPDGFIVKVRNSSFLVNIGIFDLYPKPSSTIVKHVKRNLKVQNAYVLNTVQM